MMKRIFGKKEKPKEDVTVEMLVTQKEEILSQLQDEEKRYQTTRQTYHQSIAVVEKQEVSLRETQLRERKTEFEKITRENSDQQERLQEQIRLMQMKLDEQKSLHIQIEQRMVNEIEEMSRQVEELKDTLAKRIQQFGDPQHLLNGGVQVASVEPGKPWSKKQLDIIEGRPNRKLRSGSQCYSYSPREFISPSTSPANRRKTMGSETTLVARNSLQDGYKIEVEEEEDCYENAKDEVGNTPVNSDDLSRPI